MASVDHLIPFIYHEKQEGGSMLCAQHALNNLLQGSYFTAPDLSQIANTLDSLEQSYNDDQRGDSTNMDDTGFFSVQVLENALQVWGLTLIRWRSEALRPYQEHPHTQMAFILNLESHWLTLRRFGPVSPNPAPDADPGGGHWFNLNSFLDAPQWISKTYLGMVLQQMETEGYSVFAVIQANPSEPLALPRTEADEIATSIPEDATSFSRGTATSSAKTPQTRGSQDFGDEDMELQAALQASIVGHYEHFPRVPSVQPSASSARTPSRSATLTPGAPQRRQARSIEPEVEEIDDDEDEDEEYVPPRQPFAPPDPIAASMARSRALMERMQREQEAALRTSYEDEMTHVDSAAARRRRQEEEDEEDMLRRAIAESEAEARARDRRPVGDDDEDEEMEDAPASLPPAPRPLQRSLYDRVYDDEDAELQAALKASLESMPPGFRVPTPPPTAAHSAPAAVAPAISSRTSSMPSTSAFETPRGSPTAEEEAGVETQSEADSSVAEPEPEQLSMEEIRRRRLARFGA